MESDFVSGLKKELNYINAHDGALCTSIPEGDMWDTSFVFIHEYEEMEGIYHVTTSATVDYKLC